MADSDSSSGRKDLEGSVGQDADHGPLSILTQRLCLTAIRKSIPVFSSSCSSNYAEKTAVSLEQMPNTTYSRKFLYSVGSNLILSYRRRL